jgi:putative two-component system response regulator
MSRILVIDDEQIVRDLMIEILADGGHETLGAATAREGLARLEDESVDLVVSDIVMPGLSGLELLEAVRLLRPSLPVILVTGAGTYTNLTGALERGADGLVTKPFSHDELRRAVDGALDRAGRSELELRERLLTPTLASALANAIEARDPGLGGHCERLSAIAVRIAEETGLADELETIRLGAILHDVGKIGIPDRILLKPGPLDAEERAAMRTHTVIGDRLLEPLDLLMSVRPIVRHHHERWDGDGYPDGLAGEAIPPAARVVAVADALEAMSSDRPYRSRLAQTTILAEIRAGSGGQWDPRLCRIVVDLVERGQLRYGEDGFAVVDTILAGRGEE